MNAEKLWEDLNVQERQARLRKEAFTLREIWHKTCDLHAQNEEARKKLEQEAKLDFVPESERITLNVGGQMFETTAGILTKDRWSILADLCKKTSSHFHKQDDGSFFIDRDWWIFRHILQFLRVGTLPQDPALLLEM
ncbi:hypothetical protein CTAYLR_001529 [Chrysophaeum taylorii]|uniref:Potassium channel tetramerisation-type BTB domain-containing protein n=1 Tax=Chrysophaeum taylorii TaxID=2483200 RepID=A0AAD7XIL8_9STRA|nr:hypothetical protein CTAYLR_001529 [Chrysophaeum taylorii]